MFMGHNRCLKEVVQRGELRIFKLSFIQTEKVVKTKLFKAHYQGNSLVVQWLRLQAFTVKVWVQSLVRELNSHKPRDPKKNKAHYHYITKYYIKC